LSAELLSAAIERSSSASKSSTSRSDASGNPIA
jgi:hypothetical protein